MSHLNPFGLRRYEKSSTRFLLTICQTNINDKTLGLPSNFVSEYGDELSDIVKITDPAGHVWKVDLTKGKNNFWFDGDWDKFMKYHSISDGYSLVFKYEGMFKGTSYFRVHAFDKTNGEIQYWNDEQRIDVEEPCKNRKEISILEPESHKRRRKSRVKKEVRWSDDEDYGDACNENNDTEIDVDLQGIIVPRSFSGLYRKASLETRSAVQIACVLKPENDAFMIILQDYNIKAGYMYVPAAFTNKYLHDPGKSIKLLVSDGKEYCVGICRRGCAGRMCLTWGWSEFCRANSMRTGDACRFDLVPSEAGIILKTSIFHAYNY